MESVKKIDVHAHIGTADGEIFPTPERLLEIYDILNIEKGVLLPLTTAGGRYPKLDSEYYRKAAMKYPDRFVWFCDCDPLKGDILRDMQAYKEMGAKGLGELASQFYMDSPELDNLFSACEEMGLPVTIHIAPEFGKSYGIVDDLGLPRLEKVLKKHPNLIVLGHSQPFWAEMSAEITAETRNDYPTGKVIRGRIWELMERYENLYSDCSAGSGMNALMRDPENAAAFLHRFSDRVLFGCDMATSWEMHVQFDRFLDQLVADSMLSHEDYRKFVRDNAIRLLKL